MAILVELTPETEAQLQAKAKARGMSLDAYVKSLAENAAATTPLEDAVAFYAIQRFSQGEAAQSAGMSRAEFLAALNQAGVSAFQYDSVEELLEEARG